MAPPVKYYTLSLPHTISQGDLGKNFVLQFLSAHVGKVISIATPQPQNSNTSALGGLPLLLSQG